MAVHSARLGATHPWALGQQTGGQPRPPRTSRPHTHSKHGQHFLGLAHQARVPAGHGLVVGAWLNMAWPSQVQHARCQALQASQGLCKPCGAVQGLLGPQSCATDASGARSASASIAAHSCPQLPTAVRSWACCASCTWVLCLLH